MNKLCGVLLFASGAVGGFIGGYFYAKNRYENLADKEVASVKESLERYYESRILKKDENNKTSVNKEKHKTGEDLIPEMGSSSIKTMKLGPNNDEYHDYAARYKTIEKPDIDDKPIPEEDPNAPYIITPEEFGCSEYECQTLIYYADKVVADDDYNELTHVKSNIGTEAIKLLDQNPTMDSIYVRNDNLKIDYEILYDTRNFWDLTTKIRRYPKVEDDE